MKFILGLLYENGEPSLVRLISALNWIVFIWSLWYVCNFGPGFKAEEWYFWGSVTAGCGGFGGALPMANKYVVGRYNTNQGETISKLTPQGGSTNALGGTQLKI